MEEKGDFKLFVIGIGLPRTGTTSTKAALDILLPGKCMHMTEVFKDTKTAMNKLYNNDVTDNDFRKYFEKYNYVAGLDLPFIIKYEQAIRVFPDALVLLTVRDPEGWVRSMKNTICHFHGENSIFSRFPYGLFLWIFAGYRRVYEYLNNEGPLTEAIRCIHKGNGAEYYNRYVEEMKAKIPAERLLVFNVKEGWKPLCDALGLPIPNQPFPNVNDTKTFQTYIRMSKNISWGIFIAAVTIPLIVGYGLNRYFEIDSFNNIQDYLYGLYKRL